MKESDWKIFKKIKEKALESFCLQAFDRYSAVINNEKEDAHDRYITHYNLVREKDKELGRLFDGHSRSRASMQLLLIRKNGLADEELLQQLSNEFFQETDPEKLI